jgi:hypothetical protein
MVRGLSFRTFELVFLQHFVCPAAITMIFYFVGLLLFGVWARKLRNRGSIPGKGEILFISLYRPYWPWGLPIIIQWAPAAPSLEIERLGPESENLLPCFVEI